MSTPVLESWTVAKQIPAPKSFQDSVCGTVEIVGIHWLETRGDRLIVTYRSHGVQYVCFLPSNIYYTVDIIFLSLRRVWDLSSGTIIASISTTSSTMYVIFLNANQY